jgi:hypothetical protein
LCRILQVYAVISLKHFIIQYLNYSLVVPNFIGEGTLDPTRYSLVEGLSIYQIHGIGLYLSLLLGFNLCYFYWTFYLLDFCSIVSCNLDCYLYVIPYNVVSFWWNNKIFTDFPPALQLSRRRSSYKSTRKNTLRDL